MSPRVKLYLMLLFVLVAVGCTTPPTPTPTPVPLAMNASPTPAAVPTATWNGAGMPPYPWPPTETPIPTPNAAQLEATRTFLLTPSPTPWPTALIYGMEEAPAEEQEEYFSTTLVVAPFGAGPGELGYSEPTSSGGGDCCMGGPRHAYWIAADPRGNIYVWDMDNGRLVQFDPEGQFIRNIAAPQIDPGYSFAVDGAGRFYFYDYVGDIGIDCYDDAGQLLQHLSWPDRAEELRRFYVDEQGMIWITAVVDDFAGPEVQGSPYPWATIPLGSCDQPLSAAEQKAQTRPGVLMPSGGILIASGMDARRHYVYDEQGVWRYEVPVNEVIFDLDTNGYVMTLDSRYGRVHEYNPKGQVVATFQVCPDFYPDQGNVAISQGTIYMLRLDMERGEYRITRWGEGKP